MAVKTRESRWLNRRNQSLMAMMSGRWSGIVPKSVALANHCKDRNYGTNRTQEAARNARNAR